MILWDHFDKNEIFLLIFLIAAYIIVFLFPRIFTSAVLLLSFVWGITVGMIFDFTIGGGLLDYYKTNDSNQYELFDLLYFCLYGPFGYLYFYFYERLKINNKSFIFYVVGWSLVGVVFQWLFMKLGILTLQNGYKLSYSFIIFLAIQTVSGIYYENLRKKEAIINQPS
ncbi:hypothetical protein [Cytobacillus gottheilii]|uniref:Rod shape-determining protein MreD n=1 Tax=Cytobacillus gottheilii TaxID=859144 RepID=A0ABX8F896_9BACI|nr:hypothetical protein [Cytobacillus gottheilii]QVY59711.1 hypothetical protein J1899_11585 [Cytobacillus gottheilii]